MNARAPLVIFLAVSIFFLLPIAFLVYGSFAENFRASSLTTHFLVQVITSPQTLSLLANTLEYSIGSTVISVVLGLLYSWFMKTDVPGKKILRLLPIFPLSTPLLVKALGWIFLLSPRIGLVNSFFEGLGFPGPIFNVFSMQGMILVDAVGGIPLVYLMIEPALNSIDSSIEDASRAAGAGPFRTFLGVTLPIITPAVVSAFVLEVIVGAEEFDYPFILGSPARIFTLGTYAYNLIDVSSNFSLAAAYGVIFLALTLTLMTIYIWFTLKSYRFVTVTGKAATPSVFRLGAWRWAGLLFCLVTMAISVFLPLSILIMVSFVPHYTVGPGINPFATLSLVNYIKAFHIPLLEEAVINSFTVSLSAAVIATVLGTIMSYTLVKSKTRGRRILEYISTLPLSFPGVIYSIGLVWTFLVIPGLNGIYGSIWVMLIALVVVWLPFSIRFVSNNMVQISDELEEAARITGSSWIRRFWDVIIPLLRRGFANSFLYVTVNSFRELGAVVLLSSGSSLTLTVLILNLYQNTGGAALPTVAALSVLMTAILTLLIVIIRLLSSRGMGSR